MISFHNLIIIIIDIYVIILICIYLYEKCTRLYFYHKLDINQKNGIHQCKSSLYLIYDHMTNINKKKQIMR